MNTVQAPQRLSDLAGSSGKTEEASHAGTGFRHDIEGLRAIAVILVVLFHAGVPLVRGGYVGVDVFFVISGFLITTQLVRELGNHGKISISHFYARRFARILPAAVVVVAGTVVAAWLWLPPVRFRSVAIDAFATAVYGLNYRLALQQTDYLAAAEAPSPLQHFWSLAVEEQFYFGWPLLLVASSLVWWGRRRTPHLTVVAVVLTVVTGASFGYGVWLTGRSAPWAYLGAPARAWELSLGALVAIAAPRLARLPRSAAVVVTSTGLLSVAVAGLWFSADTAFPGYAAALPVVGAAAILAGGCVPVTTRVSALLGTDVLRGIGRLSYSWYLWHWPVLIIAPSALNAVLNTRQRLACALFSLLLAALTYGLVENPVRSRPWVRAHPFWSITAALSMSVVLASLSMSAAQFGPSTRGSGKAADATAALASTSDMEQGLARRIALSAGTREVPANLTPALDKVAADKPILYRDGCDTAYEKVVTKNCEYGDLSSSSVVVLFGDSHAGHWFPALNKIAGERHWKLVVFTKSACSAASTLIYLPELKREYTECAQWRNQALDRIRAMRPVMVVMSSNGAGGMPVGGTGDPDQVWTDAWLTSFRKLAAEGTKLVVIGDTPRPTQHVPDCVSTHLTDVRACATPRNRAAVNPRRRDMVAAAGIGQGVTVIDPTRWFCTAQTCPVIVDNILVFRDAGHMSTAYSTLLAPLLDQQFG